MLTEKEKFLMHVVYRDDCWIWSGPFHNGACRFARSFNNHMVKTRAQRYSYCEYVRKLNSWERISSVCGNDKCVNPKHIKIVTASERFWSMVRKSDGCWEYTGSKARFGYGNFRGVPAHRYSYHLKYGVIPAGLYVCHKCDNPPCVNPDHLFLGTAKDNLKDMRDKGRWNAPRRLTDIQVEEMKSLRKGGMRYKDIASRYGVTAMSAWKAITGRTYKNRIDSIYAATEALNNNV